MGFVEFFNDNWYIFIIGGILLIIYFYYSRNKRLMNYDSNDLALILEMGLFLLIVITFQDKLFNEHGYFILSLFIFCPVYTVFIWIILNSGNYYLIESRLQGQEFYKLGLIENDGEISKDITMETGIRLHIMDKEVFETKSHFGDDFSPRYNSGDRIKHCDYFNGDMIYHPEYPDLRNISFWARVVEFVTLKDLIPDLIRKNLELTDLANTKIYKEIDSMYENLPTTLSGLQKQVTPYSIENKLKESLENQIKQKHKGLTESETKESVDNKESGEISDAKS